MYVVVSKWQYEMENEASVREGAAKMMQTINGWPEVQFAYNVRTSPDSVLAIIGYSDEASYHRLVQDPNSPFEKAAAEYGIENNAKWLWSERGEGEAP